MVRPVRSSYFQPRSEKVVEILKYAHGRHTRSQAPRREVYDKELIPECSYRAQMRGPSRNSE